jgi:hypothetical protein
MPLALVTDRVGVIDPPVVVAHCTVSPGAGVPLRVTSTRSGLVSAVATVAVWPSPLDVDACCRAGCGPVVVLSLEPPPHDATAAAERASTNTAHGLERVMGGIS